MKALIWDGSSASVVQDRAKPRLRPDYLLVRVEAVALNPTDCKAICQGRAAKDGLLGCDFAGIVEEIGVEVNKLWQAGDRVFGCVHGANFNEPEDGSFAEVIAVKGDTAMRIPESLSFEEAASMGVSALTCGQGLFQKMGLNLPGQQLTNKKFLLIEGGSTSAGAIGIQYARLYGTLTRTSTRDADFLGPATSYSRPARPGTRSYANRLGPRLSSIIGTQIVASKSTNTLVASSGLRGTLSARNQESKSAWRHSLHIQAPDTERSCSTAFHARTCRSRTASS